MKRLGRIMYYRSYRVKSYESTYGFEANANSED